MPTYRELFQEFGITRPSELHHRLGISQQAAHRLWIGGRGLGPKMLRLIHERLQIPYERLLAAERPRPPCRRRPS